MAEATLAQKVAFLSRPEAYGPGVDAVACRETHMSWVFLAGARAYKLKKPVRFSYLDFSTQARREAACQAEIKLNRRLAPDVYLEVASLTTALPSTCSGSYAALSRRVMRGLYEDVPEALFWFYRCHRRHHPSREGCRHRTKLTRENRAWPDRKSD